MADTVGERFGGGRRCVVVALLLLAAVVLPALANPGSGTAVNFQRADDVAGLAMGDHHAKTLPDALELLAVTAAVAVGLLRVLAGAATGPVLPGRLLGVAGGVGSSLVAASGGARRRGPPFAG